MPERTSDIQNFDAIIVGAGVGGLYAIYRLRKLGLKVRAFEAGDGVGGTWYWNRYPGCRCDVESLEYSYSFSDELQQEWHWPERYGTQPEILRYINHVADRFDLRRDIEFNTRVKEAVFDSKTNLWTVKTDKGHIATARYCIMATGNLSTPRKPSIAGLESFKGKWYHTGLWPHEGVDFTGLRVGVIGTGSSGVQSIPIIAKQAKHLYVFQRTANFSLPARNAPMPPDKERAHKAEYPERRRAAYDTPFGIAGYPPPVKSALEATEEERQRAYEAKWAEGGSISFLVFVHGFAGQQGVKRHRIGVCPPEDPRHGQGSQDGRTAMPQRPSDRHQAAHPRYRLLRDLQSRQRHLGGYPKQANPGNHADRVAHCRCRV